MKPKPFKEQLAWASIEVKSERLEDVWVRASKSQVKDLYAEDPSEYRIQRVRIVKEGK